MEMSVTTPAHKLFLCGGFQKGKTMPFYARFLRIISLESFFQYFQNSLEVVRALSFYLY